MAKVILSIIGLYVINILYGIDVLANIILGGDKREPISSRLGKGQLASKPVHSLLARVVDAIFLLLTKEENHCKNSIKVFDDEYSLSSIITRYRKDKVNSG